MKKLLVGAALILILPLVVEAIEPRKRLLIHQVIQVMNIQESLEFQRSQNVDLMRKTLEQQAGEKAHQMYVIRLRNRVMEKYAEYAKELFDWYQWEKRYVAYYDAAFTEPQLKELLAFLKTGTGQALLKSQGELAAQVQQQMAESAEETQKRIDRMIKEAIAEVGEEVQAGISKLQTATPAELEKQAHGGDPVAQYLTGQKYARGEGVEKNPVEAVKWFRLAAEQDNRMARAQLGVCYMLGEGVDKDLAQARQYFQEAAEAGDDLGAYSLGYLYLNGMGMEKDTKEAFRWLLQAANAGHGAAQHHVAMLYWNGDGVERNLSEAFAWVRVAEEAGVEGADKFHEFMNPRLTADQIADGGMRFVELKRAIKARKK